MWSLDHTNKSTDCDNVYCVVIQLVMSILLSFEDLTHIHYRVEWDMYLDRMFISIRLNTERLDN